MRTRPARAMTRVCGRPTNAVADTAARRSRRVLSGLTAAVLAIGGLALIPLVGGQTEAQAADPPKLAMTGIDPGWETAPTVEAVWLHELNPGSIYWTSDHVTGHPGPSGIGGVVGNTEFALGESYFPPDATSDTSPYNTRAAMLFRRTDTRDFFGSNLQFSSVAMARVGGETTNPDAPLAIYMWSYTDSADRSTLKNCQPGYMPIVRIISGESKVEVGCAPRLLADYGYSDPGKIGGTMTSGGEADQVTGYLYFQSRYEELDQRSSTASSSESAASNTANASRVQFAIWDPKTGAYATSGPVQPADWVNGMTTVPQERKRLFACSQGETSNCNSASQIAASDFGVDAAGNIYIYTGSDFSVNVSNYAATLVRIVPARDVDGKVLNGTATTPWKYNVVTKVNKQTGGDGWSSGTYIWGTGIHNGMLFLGARVSTTVAGTRRGTWVTRTPSTMVRIDPLSGLGRVIGADKNETLSQTINALGGTYTPVNGADYAPGAVSTDPSKDETFQYRDNASGEQLNVINGTVYNDANGNGIIESTEKPLSGVTVALYDSSTVLKGTLVTGSTGTYSFIVPKYGTYSVRVVQPKVGGANAVQTWASGSTGDNPAMAQCVNGVNGKITTSEGAPCGGAKTGPFADPDIESVGGTGDPTQWPIYSTVDMNSYKTNGNANFGVTTVGSYGDAAAGPETGAIGAPFHVNAVPASIFLGDVVGAYGGPATDNASHNGTDDGVYLDTVAGKIPLANTMLVANHTYTNLTAQVSGSDAKSVNASVVGWATDTSGSWMPTKVWAPAIDGATGIATGDFATGPVGSQQFRFDASTVESTSPVNDSGQYPGAGNWMSPGEIEDYSVTLQDNVYRVALKTTGSDDTFTLDGTGMIVSSDKFTVFPAATATGKTATVRVDASSDGWTVADVKIIDTGSGADLSDQVHLDSSTSGLDTTITWDVVSGNDVIVQVIFTKSPDADESTLTLDKDTATAGSAIKATATVVNVDDQPMQGQVVTFAKKSTDTTLSASTCTTDVHGECSITITSNTAGTYTDELSATMMVKGAAKPVSGSPKTVTFTTGAADPAKSNLVVEPINSVVVGEAVGNTFVATTTVHDAGGINPVAGETVTYSITKADGSPVDKTKTKLSSATCPTDSVGTCEVSVTSTEAGSFLLHSTVKDTDVVGSAATLVFLPDTAHPSITESTFTVDQVGPLTVGATYTGTATVKDAYGNVLSGVGVTFGTSGSAVVAPVTCVTNTSGVCAATLTDAKAETVSFFAKVKESPTASLSTIASYDRVFTSGPVSAAKSTLTLSPVTQTVGLPVTATVTVRDGNDNPITGLAVADVVLAGVSKTAGVLDTQLEVSGFRDMGSGVYTFQVTSKPAGTYQVSATVKGVGITGTPNVTFTAGAADPLKSQLVVSAGPLFVGTAVGNTYTATTTVTDSHGNLLDDQTVTYAVTRADGTAVDSAKTKLSRSSCVTASGGTCAVSLTSTEPGSFKISAQISTTSGSAAVTNSPAAVDYRVDTDHPSASTSTFTVDQVGPITVGTTYTGTATVKDAYGNVLSGVGVTFGTSGSAVVAPVTCVTNTSGVCAATLTDAKAETVSFFAKVKESPTASLSTIASYDRVFTSGPVSAAKSTLTLSPVTQTVGLPVTATVTVRDGNDNPITGLAVADVVLAGVSKTAGVLDTQLEVSGFRDMGSGVYTFQVTSKPAGTYQVSATVKGVGITGTPNVTFTAGGVCVKPVAGVDAQHQTRVEMTVNDQVADGKTQDQAVAYAFDCYGNPVENAPVVIEDKSTGDLAGQLSPTIATGSTDVSGAVTLSWTSEKAGSFTAESLINGLKPDHGGVLSGSNGIRFSTGGADPKNSSLDVIPDRSIVVNNSFTATATVKDAKGNLATGEVVTFSASSSDVTLSGTTCTTLSTGQCSVTVTSKVAGQYTVSATVSSGGKAVTVTNSPADVEFVAGDVCFTGCAPADPTHVTRVEVTTNGSQANGTTRNEVTVYAYDAFGNPVKDADVATTTSDTSLTIVTGTAKTDANGVAKLAYTSTKTGTKTADVTVAGQTPTGSPVALSFSSVQADPSVSSMSIKPKTSQIVDSFFDVTATVKDKDGNLVTDAVVSFTVDDANAVLQQTSCTTDASGTCVVQVTSQIVGTYAIHGMIANSVAVMTEIQDSPVSAQFAAGPLCVSSEGCVADPGVPKTAVTAITNGAANDGKAQNLVKVSAFDKHGNPIPGVAVSSQPGDADLGVQTVIQPTGVDGTTTIAYTSLVAGSHDASVLLDGSRTPEGSPVTLIFGSNLGSAPKSTFTVSSTGPLAVGQDAVNTYTATAVVHDANDDPAQDVVVTFAVDPSAGPQWTSDNICVTDKSGMCSVSVASTVVGTFTMSASISDGPLSSGTGSGTPQYGVPIAWKADAVCALGCTPVDPNTPADRLTRVDVTTNDQIADGDAHDIATIYAFDKWGNPVPSVVVLSTSTDAGLHIQDGIAGTDANGVSTIWYASDKAGSYTADVTLDGSAVAGSPLTVTFVPGPVDSTQSVVTVDALKAHAGNYVAVTATISDAMGNVIPNIDVTFTVDNQGRIAAGIPSGPITINDKLVQTLTATTGADGKAVVVVTDLIAETNNVSVMVFGAQVSAPQPVTFVAAGLCVAPTCGPDPSVDNDHRSRVVVTTDNQLSDGIGLDEAMVWVFDKYGNPVAGAKVGAATTDSALTIESLTAVTRSDGSARITFSTMTVGKHVASVTVDGLPVVFVPQSGSALDNPAAIAAHSSPVTLTFVAPPVAPLGGGMVADGSLHGAGVVALLALLAVLSTGVFVKRKALPIHR